MSQTNQVAAFALTSTNKYTQIVRNSVTPQAVLGGGINIDGYGLLHYGPEIRDTPYPA